MGSEVISILDNATSTTSSDKDWPKYEIRKLLNTILVSKGFWLIQVTVLWWEDKKLETSWGFFST